MRLNSRPIPPLTVSPWQRMLAASMRRLSPLALVIASLSVLAACGDDDDVVPMDAAPPVDAWVPTAELFDPCQADTDCVGEGAVCKRDADGYPQGMCTVACTDRTPCDRFGSYHHCVIPAGEESGFCEPRCLNGLDCGRLGYTCRGGNDPTGGLCFGVCTADDQCSTGLECDLPTGKCIEPGTAPTTGAAIGAACTTDSGCRSGICREESGANDEPTGWVGGTCIGNCVLPAGYNNTNIWPEQDLPSGTCGASAVCYLTESLAELDLGVCLPRCGNDEDCRDGYRCRRIFQLGSGPRVFDTAFCAPVQCPDEPCPTGYSCMPVPLDDGTTMTRCVAVGG